MNDFINYFYTEESSENKGKFLIRLNTDKIDKISFQGSLNVLAARVMNLNYANYLRMCRDIYGAEIIGKNKFFPVAYFTNLEKAKSLEKELNKRINLICMKGN